MTSWEVNKLKKIFLLLPAIFLILAGCNEQGTKKSASSNQADEMAAERLYIDNQTLLKQLNSKTPVGNVAIEVSFTDKEDKIQQNKPNRLILRDNTELIVFTLSNLDRRKVTRIFIDGSMYGEVSDQQKCSISSHIYDGKERVPSTSFGDHLVQIVQYEDTTDANKVTVTSGRAFRYTVVADD